MTSAETAGALGAGLPAGSSRSSADATRARSVSSSTGRPTRSSAGRSARPAQEPLGRALAEASGLVRLRNPDGTVTRWVKAADAPALLEEGWSRA